MSDKRYRLVKLIDGTWRPDSGDFRHLSRARGERTRVLNDDLTWHGTRYDYETRSRVPLPGYVPPVIKIQESTIEWRDVE